MKFLISSALIWLFSLIFVYFHKGIIKAALEQMSKDDADYQHIVNDMMLAGVIQLGFVVISLMMLKGNPGIFVITPISMTIFAFLNVIFDTQCPKLIQSIIDNQNK